LPKKPNVIWRALSRVIAQPWVSAAAMRIATRIDRPLLKVSRGRLRLSFVIPCLLLRVSREIPVYRLRRAS
jgi:hypothetical protein